MCDALTPSVFQTPYCDLSAGASPAPVKSVRDLAGLPVGVLDSGLGGLSVLKSLTRTLPQTPFIYCADSGNAPWGDKSEAFIVERCREICGFLIEKGARAIVLACNTATAAAADQLRKELTLPVIGIEPAVKPAAAQSRRHVIGVLATTRTIESTRYKRLVARFAPHTTVVSVAAPGLMECVEAAAFESPATEALVRHYLAPMQEAGIDKLVLGCTHYPFLMPLFARILGPKVELIEPGPAVAAVTRARLLSLLENDQGAEEKLAAGVAAGKDAGTGAETEAGSPSCTFFVKGSRTHAAALRRLWPQAEAIAELPV